MKAAEYRAEDGPAGELQQQTLGKHEIQQQMSKLQILQQQKTERSYRGRE